MNCSFAIVEGLVVGRGSVLAAELFNPCHEQRSNWKNIEHKISAAVGP